jgi:putative acetyltransferase
VAMTITLLPISQFELAELALGSVPAQARHNAGPGALPPTFVAARALEQLASGKPLHWCSTFYIVRSEDQMIVGGCGFKDSPINGVVEIGYAVASSCRNQGIATQAIAALLKYAFAGDEVHQVLAQINPDNIASTKVAEKTGFVRAGNIVDDDGEVLVQWVVAKSPMSVTIAPLNPYLPEACHLLDLSDAYMGALYPAESNHLEGPDALASPNVYFLGARHEGQLVACGAVKTMDNDGRYGEIKRVYIVEAFRGKGLSKLIMQRLEQHLRTQGIHVARLETGIHQPEALGLYEKLGYGYRTPFGSYQPDPLSVFMEKTLDPI